MKNKRSGFTLIEIVVVIAIIGILTVIIFPSINNIRAKNRDAERIADIATLQLELSFYKNQNQNGVYPMSIQNNINFSPKYAPADALVGPDGKQYTYIPLTKDGTNCTYYHLGVTLELPNAQIDQADTFSSARGAISNGYAYCDSTYAGPGLFPPNYALNKYNYNVHP